MPKSKQELNLSFQLINVDIIDFILIPCSLELMVFKIFNFNINIEQRIAQEIQNVFVITTIDIIHEDKTTKLGSIKVNCIFNIANMSDFIDKATNKVVLPDTVVSTLNSISLSTTRGVMYGQFKGTFLHNAILPLIDPKSFSPSTNKM